MKLKIAFTMLALALLISICLVAGSLEYALAGGEGEWLERRDARMETPG
jgi:hypothetical protein